ncbi:hypothetical protein LTR28_004296, partial [Elasticomyces elasticus]
QRRFQRRHACHDNATPSRADDRCLQSHPSHPPQNPIAPENDRGGEDRLPKAKTSPCL